MGVREGRLTPPREPCRRHLPTGAVNRVGISMLNSTVKRVARCVGIDRWRAEKGWSPHVACELIVLRQDQNVFFFVIDD